MIYGFISQQSAYSYWFRNYGGTGGFCGIVSEFQELSGCSYWNLAYVG